MRVSSRTKATALLLLVSLQYAFAGLDIALCSSALCYPKITGAKYGPATAKCPSGYELGTDTLGKPACVRKTPVPCPDGTELRDGRCCGAATAKACQPQPSSGGCPAGYSPTKDCAELPGHPLAGSARRLQSDNPLLKEINIVGHSIVPNVVIPKPAIQFSIAPSPPREQPKIDIPSMQVPQIILPEPPITFSVPEIPKVGPELKWEGSGSLIPNIIPILPEPPITITMPPDGIPQRLPNLNTDLSQKVVTLDLSRVGPSHTVDVNLPAMPDLIREAAKLPDIEVNMPQGPKVIDLSSLGPKKSLDVKLPEVKLPKQGTITVVNSGDNKPQYLDLTGFGKKNQTGYNIVLPAVNTEGATLNVIFDDHNITDIVIPGNGGQHNTVINVPGHGEDVQKKAKLVVDVKTNPGITLHSGDLGASRKFNVTKVNVTMPSIDLSKHLPAGPDVVIDVKPLLAFGNHTTTDRPEPKQIKRVNVQMKNITIPRLLNDTTVILKPSIALNKLLPGAISGPHDKVAPINATTTIINLPNGTLPKIPVPGGKTDVGVHVPIKLGLAKNTSDPDATIDVYYKEEWVGGNPILPNPTAAVTNAVGKAVNAVTTISCPTKCCAETTVDSCKVQEFTLETLPVQYECAEGTSYDSVSGQCVGSGTVADCPAGLAKCSIGGKGVCAPVLGSHTPADICGAFKTLCASVGVFAKSCVYA